MCQIRVIAYDLPVLDDGNVLSPSSEDSSSTYRYEKTLARFVRLPVVLACLVWPSREQAPLLVCVERAHHYVSCRRYAFNTAVMFSGVFQVSGEKMDIFAKELVVPSGVSLVLKLTEPREVHAADVTGSACPRV